MCVLGEAGEEIRVAGVRRGSGAGSQSPEQLYRVLLEKVELRKAERAGCWRSDVDWSIVRVAGAEKTSEGDGESAIVPVGGSELKILLPVQRRSPVPEPRPVQILKSVPG